MEDLQIILIVRETFAISLKNSKGIVKNITEIVAPYEKTPKGIVKNITEIVAPC